MRNFKKVMSNDKRGFTIIELLVVTAIIAILASVVLALLSQSSAKTKDGSVKANLSNAMKQGEIFYITNTIVPNSYTNICTNGMVGGIQGVGLQVLMAARETGYSSYSINATGSATTATCNHSAGAWAAEVPLTGSTTGSPKLWCVDSTGKSKQETASSLSSAVDYTCI